MAVAWDTPVAGPVGARPIQEVRKRDELLFGSGSPGTWYWSPEEVAFSDGVAPGAKSTGCFISWKNGGKLLVTLDQLLLTPAGKLKRAGDLAPGVDQLVSIEGAAMAIERVALAEVTGGWHHVASSLGWRGSVDNHLIAVNGIVAADQMLCAYGRASEP
jgi:hypothetical protein